MSNPPSPPWTLGCPWCDFRIVVNARGAHGNDPGSGVEAATMMAAHVGDRHGKTWREFLDAEELPNGIAG
jgi:hypothetical protein